LSKLGENTLTHVKTEKKKKKKKEKKKKKKQKISYIPCIYNFKKIFFKK